MFLVCWDGDGGFPVGIMITCGDRADDNVWEGGSGLGCPLGRKLDDRRRGRGGFRIKLHNKKQRSLGPEWSLSEFVTPPPNNLDIPHRLAPSNKHTNQLKISYRIILKPPKKSI